MSFFADALDNLVDGYKEIGQQFSMAGDHFANGNILGGLESGAMGVFGGLGHTVTLGATRAISSGTRERIENGEEATVGDKLLGIVTNADSKAEDELKAQEYEDKGEILKANLIGGKQLIVDGIEAAGAAATVGTVGGKIAAKGGQAAIGATKAAKAADAVGDTAKAAKAADAVGDTAKAAKAVDAVGDTAKAAKAADAVGDTAKAAKAADAVGDTAKAAETAEKGAKSSRWFNKAKKGAKVADKTAENAGKGAKSSHWFGKSEKKTAEKAVKKSFSFTKTAKKAAAVGVVGYGVSKGSKEDLERLGTNIGKDGFLSAMGSELKYQGGNIIGDAFNFTTKAVSTTASVAAGAISQQVVSKFPRLAGFVNMCRAGAYAITTYAGDWTPVSWAVAATKKFNLFDNTYYNVSFEDVVEQVKAEAEKYNDRSLGQLYHEKLDELNNETGVTASLQNISSGTTTPSNTSDTPSSSNTPDTAGTPTKEDTPDTPITSSSLSEPATADTPVSKRELPSVPESTSNGDSNDYSY